MFSPHLKNTHKSKTGKYLRNMSLSYVQYACTFIVSVCIKLRHRGKPSACILPAYNNRAEPTHFVSNSTNAVLHDSLLVVLCVSCSLTVLNRDHSFPKPAEFRVFHRNGPVRNWFTFSRNNLQNKHYLFGSLVPATRLKCN